MFWPASRKTIHSKTAPLVVLCGAGGLRISLLKAGAWLDVRRVRIDATAWQAFQAQCSSADCFQQIQCQCNGFVTVSTLQKQSMQSEAVVPQRLPIASELVLDHCLYALPNLCSPATFPLCLIYYPGFDLVAYPCELYDTCILLCRASRDTTSRWRPPRGREPLSTGPIHSHPPHLRPQPGA